MTKAKEDKLICPICEDEIPKEDERYVCLQCDNSFHEGCIIDSSRGEFCAYCSPEVEREDGEEDG